MKKFHISNEPGPLWTVDIFQGRLSDGPDRIELLEGRLFASEEERLSMLGALLEQVGADKAVQLGDPDVWRRAVAKLPA